MYCVTNFKTKKELIAAVAEYNRQATVVGHTAPHPVRIFAPGLGTPAVNGWDTVEGPHFPQPHKWYAKVRLADGIVVEIR